MSNVLPIRPDVVPDVMAQLRSISAESGHKPFDRHGGHDGNRGNNGNGDNEDMNTVSKDLLNARLETIEVRMDARMARIEELIGDTRKGIELMRQESRADNKSTRTTMIVTGISSVLAIVLGVGAFNATVLSNMVASFESGKNTASMLANSEKAIKEATQALVAAQAQANQAAIHTQQKPEPTAKP